MQYNSAECLIALSLKILETGTFCCFSLKKLKHFLLVFLPLYKRQLKVRAQTIHIYCPSFILFINFVVSCVYFFQYYSQLQDLETEYNCKYSIFLKLFYLHVLLVSCPPPL